MIRKFHADTTPDRAKIAEIEAKIAENASDAEQWYFLGCEYSQSDFEKSLKAYSVAIGLDPFNAEYYFNRARKYLSICRFEEALADFVTALRIDRSDGQYWHYLGVALYYLGRYDEAAEYFADALRMNRKFGVDCVWPEVDWMWMSYMRAGKREEAAACLSQVEDDWYSSEGDMAYKKRVRLYKGLISIDAYMRQINRADKLDEMTDLYGAANYYRFIDPNAERAEALLDEIIAIEVYHNGFAWMCANFDKRGA